MFSKVSGNITTNELDNRTGDLQEDMDSQNLNSEIDEEVNEDEDGNINDIRKNKSGMKLNNGSKL